MKSRSAFAISLLLVFVAVKPESFLLRAQQPIKAPSQPPTDNALTTIHDASQAVEQLDVHADLSARLFASEPMLTNPASIDVDHLGRIWICEAINYRAFRNADVIGDRQQGDRILVLEDVDGDAQADKSTVFYEGHDVDSAHGIMVMPTSDGPGTKAIVSALDSVFFLIDDDGDLRADRKELLFTGIGGSQHDHGVHAFHFGPDGKLYFNFGNEGRQIRDKSGQPIIDKSGREVNGSRRPYQEGMVFRCNLDGSEFETLAWNFRNNWEVCVDSFGAMWQSDNDDDGNQGVRINYVMEYGNYGYRDELTGAAWSEPRTNWEATIPERHWHLNDPGVVPNLLQTGAGAPTGICIYEGDLLPPPFRGAVIHTDAGPNVCRAYVTKPIGAGYAAEIVNILDGARNKWFRPSDVCIAPDGSLFVADWYDPGVGGHRMEDVAHGRIFRVAPRGEADGRYRIAPIDLTTPQGATVALKSPNMATRWMAWTALTRMGQKANDSLIAMRRDDNPVFQARAMWLLGKLAHSEADAASVVRQALADENDDLRAAGVRLARQLAHQLNDLDLQDLIRLDDLSPAVRRELLIDLREAAAQRPLSKQRDDQLAQAWAKLASRYEGQDRWYLEALGIAAEERWDKCLAALADECGPDWTSRPGGRDILWRSRGQRTSELIAAVILNPQTSSDEILRFFRALDFQSLEERQPTLPVLAFGDHHGLDDDRVSTIRLESLDRLKGVGRSFDASQLSIVEGVLEACAGTDRFVKLVDGFSVVSRYSELLALAQAQPESQLAVDALTVLFDKGQSELIGRALKDADANSVEKTLVAMKTAGDARGNDALAAILADEARPLAVRRLAVKALAASSSGAESLLHMAERQTYPSQLGEALAAALNSASSPAVREAAAAVFPTPAMKDDAPLPPLRDLAAMQGDAERGRAVFNAAGSCSKCHQPNNEGREVGPDLTTIGAKLAREAMFESILYPSAAISHNFENWLVLTQDGLSHGGLLVSESDRELKLKDAEGIVRTIPSDAIVERKQSDVSLMPNNVQTLISTQELVDVVEYLSTLTGEQQSRK